MTRAATAEPVARQPEDEGERDACQAVVRGGARCRTPKIFQKQFCRRHLDQTQEMDDTVTAVTAPVPSCSVPGCLKPKYGHSAQCERHYKKALRNNTEYRARAKQALNGTVDGTTWKAPVLETLFKQREMAVLKLAEIDQAITSIKGL